MSNEDLIAYHATNAFMHLNELKKLTLTQISTSSLDTLNSAIAIADRFSITARSKSDDKAGIGAV